MAVKGSNFRWFLVIEALVGLAMVLASFAMIDALGGNLSGTLTYWSFLVGGFALVTFAADRIYAAHRLADLSSALKIILHWAGVLVALNAALYFATSGRMAAEDMGLVGGLVLGVGTFLAGVHVNWRLMVVGAAIVAETHLVAYIEEHVWFTVGVMAVTITVIALGSLLSGRIRHSATTGSTADASAVV